MKSYASEIQKATIDFLKTHGPASAHTIAKCIGCDEHDVRVIVTDMMIDNVLHVISAGGNASDRLIGVVGVHNQMSLL